jgi:hypothetical protein
MNLVSNKHIYVIFYIYLSYQYTNETHDFNYKKC